MPYGGWGTPLMLAALACVVQDRQGTNDQQRNRGEDNQ